MFKSLKWEDWVGIGLGAWLLTSPWALGFSDQAAPTVNALTMGTILVLEELLQLVKHEVAGEWINLVVGSWLIISPLVFNFASDVAAAANTVAVGLLTVLFSAWAISPLDEKCSHWWHAHAVNH